MAYEDEPYDDEFDDEELLDEDEQGEDLEQRERNAMLTGWGISLALHAIVALILLFVVVAVRLVQNIPPTRSVDIETIEVPPEEEEELRELEEQDVTIEHEVEVKNPTVQQLVVEIEELSTEDPEVPEVMEPKGREEAKATCETGSTGAFMAIGGGGGGSGAFGNRRGGGRRRALGKYGGSKGSQSAVLAALRWFKRHQSENGMWDVDGYPVNCTLAGPKCEPGSNVSGADAAVTGYALLCFLGAGYDHKVPNQFQKTIQKGLDWLVDNQKGEGRWGRNYENGVCTMALAEAYAMTMDKRLREPAQKGVDFLLSKQNPGEGKDAYGGSGWNYVGPTPTRNDSSVTGWCVMALKSAKAAQLDTKGGLEGCKWWLEETWKATNPNWETVDQYDGKTQFPYTFNEVTKTTARNHLSCIGALCAVFLGYNAEDKLLTTMCNDILDRHLDKSRTWPTDSYYMYYNTLALFQHGGDKLEQWNKVVRDMLVNSQRKGDGCFDGSWDPNGAGGHRIAHVGRTIVTAYACLSLEVYYRYLPVGVKN